MNKKQCILFKNTNINWFNFFDIRLDQIELSSRKNIYDNDEFDVYTKNKIDLSKVYLGKKYLYKIQ